MDPTTLAYLAGAMDSDGWFGIRKSTYRQRVRGDAMNASYSERAGLKQVTSTVPSLLRDCFGGTLSRQQPQAANGKPLYAWLASDTNAARTSESLLPYLRIKRHRAELLLELRESKKAGYGKPGYWFARQFPNWHEMELITSRETAVLLGYKSRAMVSQAIRLGMLVGLPYEHRGMEIPRVPRVLVETVLQYRGKDGRCRLMPRELVEWRERLYQEARELNKIGVDGTSVYHRTGPHALEE